MNHASLFSGIGGAELAAEWMGWDNVFHCEINPFGRRVLDYYWPNAKSYEDITKTDFSIWRGRIHILTGGFPCQPFSLAGKRKGTEDDRNLWPNMFKAIQQIKPNWVVCENVYGLVNWNGGMVFDQVQVDLEAEGYEVWSVILPACAVNAPHRRDRVWIIAHLYGKRLNGLRSKCRAKEISKQTDRIKTPSKKRITSNTNNPGLERSIQKSGKTKRSIQEKRKSISGFNSRSKTWDNFPTQPPICGGNDGLPSGLDGITFPKWRNESIKAYGNAWVPQVAYEIFKVIEQINHKNITSL